MSGRKSSQLQLTASVSFTSSLITDGRDLREHHTLGTFWRGFHPNVNFKTDIGNESQRAKHGEGIRANQKQGEREVSKE